MPAPAFQDAPSPLNDACGDNPSGFCEWVFDRTDSEVAAQVVNWLIGRPLRIVLIVVLGLIANRLLRRGITRFGAHLEDDTTRDRYRRLRQKTTVAGVLAPDDPDPRAAARTATVVGVLTNMSTVLIGSMVVLLVLGEVGIDLAPLLAGAGIAGIAIGFGAQTVVRDFLAGMFMLVEDQYGVGDVIDVGEVSGVVERFSLRVTVLRDVNGTVWHVPNGEITRVANQSQVWSRAVLDIEVAYDTDLRRAQGVIQRVADEVWQDPDFTAGDIIEPPEVWGVERLGADGIAIRLVVKTDPSEQWVVARELRLRIKEAFDEAGIEMPFPQRSVWIHQELPEPATRPDVEVHAVRRSAAGDELIENPGHERS